jgi:hypothetical protein
MPNFDSVLAELRLERKRLDIAIATLEGVTSDGSRRPKGRISTAGRRKIAAAQRARWAKLKGQKVVAIATPTRKNRQPLSAAARKRIAAAQKARWAAFRKKQKAA